MIEFKFIGQRAYQEIDTAATCLDILGFAKKGYGDFLAQRLYRGGWPCSPRHHMFDGDFFSKMRLGGVELRVKGIENARRIIQVPSINRDEHASEEYWCVSVHERSVAKFVDFVRLGHVIWKGGPRYLMALLDKASPLSEIERVKLYELLVSVGESTLSEMSRETWRNLDAVEQVFLDTCKAEWDAASARIWNAMMDVRDFASKHNAMMRNYYVPELI